MRTNPRPTHPPRIPIHTLFPAITNPLHSRDPALALTPISHILPSTDGHLRQGSGGRFLALLVDVGADGGPEGIAEVDEEEHGGDIKQELRVEGKRMWECGVRVDEGEEGGNES